MHAVHRKANPWELHTKAWVLWWSYKLTLTPIKRWVAVAIIPASLLTRGDYYTYKNRAGMLIQHKTGYHTPAIGLAALAAAYVTLATQLWPIAPALLLVALRYTPSIATVRETRTANADIVASNFFAKPGQWQAGTKLANSMKQAFPKSAVAFKVEETTKKEAYYRKRGGTKHAHGMWTF